MSGREFQPAERSLFSPPSPALRAAEAESKLKAAEAAVIKNEFDRAEQALSEAVNTFVGYESDPAAARTRERAEQIRKSFRKAAAEYHLAEADKALSGKQFDAAREHAEAAISIRFDPDQSDDANAIRGRYDDFMRRFEAEAMKDTVRLGEVALNQHDFEVALGKFRKAKASGESVDALIARAECLQSLWLGFEKEAMGDQTAARAAYDKAEQIGRAHDELSEYGLEARVAMSRLSPTGPTQLRADYLPVIAAATEPPTPEVNQLHIDARQRIIVGVMKTAMNDLSGGSMLVVGARGRLGRCGNEKGRCTLRGSPKPRGGAHHP